MCHMSRRRGAKAMNEERSPQEYAYITDGITTRMQLAIEKMAEANKMFRATVKTVCAVMLVVVLLVVGGFLAETKIWIDHVNNLRGAGVVGVETVQEFTDSGGN